MKIAANVEMLEVKHGEGVVYPVLIQDGDELLLVDAGFPGEMEELRRAVEAAGHKLEDITRVFLTHQDMDHVGNARVLSEMGAKLLAHELEAPYIQGDLPSVRLSDMEERLDQMSAEERAFFEQVKAGAPMFYAKIDTLLKDGEILDLAGGVKILHTPGHMPGHMALLLMGSNILIAGDAANIVDGKLTGANPQVTRDLDTAARSFEKMMAQGAASVVCYHGGVIHL